MGRAHGDGSQMLARKGPMPLYHQIERHLREDLAAERYRPGDLLPPEHELQRQFGVSRATVRTALRRLAEDGLVSSQRGRGTVVERQAVERPLIERNLTQLFAFEEAIQRQGYTPHVEVLAIGPRPVPERIAALLGVPPGTEVLRAYRLGRAGSAPLWLESRYFAPHIGAQLADAALARPSVTVYLQSVVGVRITGSRLRISAAPATVDQARYLDIAPGDALLVNEFAFSDETGRPIEAARAVFRADRYAFTFASPAPNPVAGPPEWDDTGTLAASSAKEQR